MTVTAVLPEAPTVTELLDKLQALGTHREIALFLAERGVVGTCNNAQHCPIAHYLQDETGKPGIRVGEDEMVIWRTTGAYEEQQKLPPAVKDFIAFFDSHMHPDLIDPQLPDNIAIMAKLQSPA